MGAEGAPTPDWDINNKAYNALAFLFLNNMIDVKMVFSREKSAMLMRVLNPGGTLRILLINGVGTSTQ
jgi:hypothetical protein